MDGSPFYFSSMVPARSERGREQRGDRAPALLFTARACRASAVCGKAGAMNFVFKKPLTDWGGFDVTVAS